MTIELVLLPIGASYRSLLLVLITADTGLLVLGDIPARRVSFTLKEAAHGD